MNINNGHSQFELFPKNSDQLGPHAVRSRTLIKDLTLSVENIIVVGIILLMSFVLFFSFGVERGKRLGDTVVNNGQESAVATKESVAVIGPEPVEVTIDASDFIPETRQAETEKALVQVPIKQDFTNDQSFTIQIASFKTQDRAKEEAKRLETKGYEIYVVPKGGYSIVCVGKFSKKEEAKSFSNRLKPKYRDLLVRRF